MSSHDWPISNAGCPTPAVIDLSKILPMVFKLFRKQPDSRPRFEQESSMSEALQRRVNAIEFRPSKGFLKDQKQPKRAARRPVWIEQPVRRTSAE